MEHRLRCNTLKCRIELHDHAVVTTCSHMFCIDCASQQQLTGQHEGRRAVCPVCQSQLLNPDDVVIANLNPTEDYKTSVLSGLSPQIIMECAGRGLSFWAYQATQDVLYHQYSNKSLLDKFNTLNAHLDKIIMDANSEITNLRSKISNLELDQDSWKRRAQELDHALKERIRRHNQTQELYDKAKAKSMMSQMQHAVIDAVDESSQDLYTNHNMEPPPIPPAFSHVQGTGARRTASYPNHLRSRPNQGHGLGDSHWGAGLGGPQISQNLTMQTPSTHRQQIPTGTTSFAAPMGFPNPQTNTNTTLRPSHLPRASPRPGLAPMSTNSAPTGISGYGMSAGLKVSNPPGSVVNGSRPPNRSRVAQRAPSGLSSHPTPLFGSATPNTNMFSNGDNNFR